MEVKAIASLCEHRCFSFWCKTFSCCILRAKPQFIQPKDDGVLLLSHPPDTGILFIQPLSHCSGALLIRSESRFLRGKAPLFEQSGYMTYAVIYPCFFLISRRT